MRFEVTSARGIAAFFMLYGLLATVLLAVIMPPFQNPDEPAHLLRVAQIADGTFVGGRYLVNDADSRKYLQGGGLSDPAVAQAELRFHSLPGRPETKASRQDWTPPVYWSATRMITAFPNTAIYPPFLYLPSALAVLAGRMTRATVVRTLIGARLLTGAAAVVVGTVAIGCAGAAAIWIFAILTLPMSLALDASCSADALILAFSALAAALIVRLQMREGLPGSGSLACLAVALGLVVMARPPYLPLSLLVVALTRVTWRRRIVATLAVGACAVVWSCIVAFTTLSNPGAFNHTDPEQQISLLLSDPLRILPLASMTLHTYWRDYIASFIGELGWLDTGLGRPYYVAATAMLATAALAAGLGLRREPIGIASRLVIAGAILTAIAGVFASQYLTWTIPGNKVIVGVQGRYFLPLALPAVALVPALAHTWLARLRHTLILTVLGFPVVTLGVVMRAIVFRYYLT